MKKDKDYWLSWLMLCSMFVGIGVGLVTVYINWLLMPYTPITDFLKIGIGTLIFGMLSIIYILRKRKNE